MNWYLHAVEDQDGRWSCQRGRTVFDEHADQASAVDHLKRIAMELGITASIFAHPVNEVVERVA